MEVCEWFGLDWFGFVLVFGFCGGFVLVFGFGLSWVFREVVGLWLFWLLGVCLF